MLIGISYICCFQGILLLSPIKIFQNLRLTERVRPNLCDANIISSDGETFENNKIFCKLNNKKVLHLKQFFWDSLYRKTHLLETEQVSQARDRFSTQRREKRTIDRVYIKNNSNYIIQVCKNIVSFFKKKLSKFESMYLY